MKLGGALFLGAFCGLLCSPPADALQTRLFVVSEGRASITYLGGDSNYSSSLSIESNDPALNASPLFHQWTEAGTTIELGRLAAGTELTFRLLVWNTGDTFYTGDGTRNADGLAHARATTTLDEALHVS